MSNAWKKPYWENKNKEESLRVEKKPEIFLEEWSDPETGIHFYPTTSHEVPGTVNIVISVGNGSLYGKNIEHYLKELNGFEKKEGEKKTVYHKTWLKMEEAQNIEAKLRNFRKGSIAETDESFDRAA